CDRADPCRADRVRTSGKADARIGNRARERRVNNDPKASFGRDGALRRPRSWIQGTDGAARRPYHDEVAMISFSTCWNSGRHTAGDEMLREIKDLGFNRIELGHGIRISLMPGIQKMFEAGEVEFTSLHNFCPLPVEIMQ